jgi:uncharacterized protein
MILNEITFTTATPIDGYGPGFFRIGGEALKGALCVTSTGAKSWGGFDDAKTLLDLTGEVDVLLIGTGNEICHIPARLRDQLESAGIGVEIMNSPAACRTFNVLLSEGRRVATAILPV